MVITWPQPDAGGSGGGFAVNDELRSRPWGVGYRSLLRLRLRGMQGGTWHGYRNGLARGRGLIRLSSFCNARSTSGRGEIATISYEDSDHMMEGDYSCSTT